MGGGASRQVIITYPQDTSSQMLAEARQQIEKAVCSLPSPPSDLALPSASNIEGLTKPMIKGGEILFDFGMQRTPLILLLQLRPNTPLTRSHKVLKIPIHIFSAHTHENSHSSYSGLIDAWIHDVFRGFVVKVSVETLALLNTILISSSDPQPSIEADGPMHILDGVA